MVSHTPMRSLFLRLGLYFGLVACLQAVPFEVKDGQFLSEGKPYRIIAGEMHYARIPHEYWRKRFKMARAMGLNTISTYVFWDIHEVKPGVFDFSGDKDIASFIRIAGEEGLKVILRPGPYVCGEWDFGGLPSWLLTIPDLRVRCSDDRYTSCVSRYFEKLGKELCSLQSTHGGPLIMVGVENEYGSYGSDKTYLAFVRDSLKKSGFDVPLFTCDGPDALDVGSIGGTFPVVNVDGDLPKEFGKLTALSPKTPLACGELYPGWLDHWGEAHNVRTAESITADVKWILENKVSSFSFYMFHGGTNFGFTAGANTDPKGVYQPITTQYDYDAPLDETGRVTPKYIALRNEIQAHVAEKLPDIPYEAPLMTIAPFKLTRVASLLDHLPEGIDDIQPHSMEAYGQDHGLILYRTTLRAGKASKLTIRELHDYGLVRLDGKTVSTVDRSLVENPIPVPQRKKPTQLDILVEAMGRITYGPGIMDKKGITERVEFPNPYGAGVAMGWKVYPLPLDKTYLDHLPFSEIKADVNGPVFLQGTFHVTQCEDTYLDMRHFGKGYVWVNGHALGRYWNRGPQGALYLPGCWLNQGENTVLVFDFSLPKEPVLEGLSHAVWFKPTF